MPLYKWTMFFDYKSNRNRDDTIVNPDMPEQHGGWTESVYTSNLTNNEYDAFYDLMDKRCGMLPLQASILGFRTSQVGDRSGSRIVARLRRGSANSQEDIPQMALMLTLYGSTGNLLRYIARGLPDFWVQSGVLIKDNDVRNRINRFIASLRQGVFFQRVRNFAAEKSPILTISSAGVVQLPPPGLGSLDGSMRVRVLKTVTPERRLKGGLFRLKAFTDSQNFTLAGWDTQVGLNCTDGMIRIDGVVNAAYTGAIVEYRSIIKKVGRPFFPYRGRRAATH